MKTLIDLPRDILDIVASDEVNAVDDLRSLSLVHSTLTAPAQRVLLTNLTIPCDARYHPRKRTPQDAEKLLLAVSKRNARVGVHLTLDLRVLQPKVSRRQSVVPSTAEDTTLTKSIKRILGFLPFAKTVHLLGPSATVGARSALSPSMTTEVLDFLQRSKALKEVVVSDFELPASTMCALLRLSSDDKSLELRAVDIERGGDNPQYPAAVPDSSVGRLDIVWSPKIHEYILQTPSLLPFASTLRRLAYYIHEDDQSQLLFLAKDTIEELHLHGEGPSLQKALNYVASHDVCIELPDHLPALRSVTFSPTQDWEQFIHLTGTAYADEYSNFSIGEFIERPRVQLPDVALIPRFLSATRCPRLSQVTICLLPPHERQRRKWWRGFSRRPPEDVCVEETAAMLDELVGARPRVVCRWQGADDFRELVTEAMPFASKNGLLSFG
ncbi:hypothetical protein MKEN_00018400 [Mycena kentingensis (nom. inval.)]|nr:hypothetical protein MKEN_00018400 [Mycena kentingensis (nom. inval.)]